MLLLGHNLQLPLKFQSSLPWQKYIHIAFPSLQDLFLIRFSTVLETFTEK